MALRADESAAQVSADRFRHCIGHLATGVTVITTVDDTGPHGMTASSVTSLSLDPPTILVCLNRAAPTASAVVQAGHFGVNVLGQGHERIAHQFAKPSPNKFDGVALDSRTVLPILTEALASFECEVIAEFEGGTHSIVVGRVRSANAADGRPLAYFRGSFEQLLADADDAALDALRIRILERVYPPGTILRASGIAPELGVTGSAAYFALTRLLGDGFLERGEFDGFRVVPFRAELSDEIFDARCTLELGVVRSCLSEAAGSRIAVMRDALTEMARCLVDGVFTDFEAYLDANAEFHSGLVALADNPSLLRAYDRLSVRTVMQRSFGSTTESSETFLDAQREILAAVERRDVDRSSAAITRYATMAKKRAHEVLALSGGAL